MGKSLKKLIAKKNLKSNKIPLDKFLGFDARKPDDAVAFHKHRLLFQLNDFMLTHDITKAELAKRLSISRQAVTNKFLGETLSLDWLVRAFAALGVGFEMKQSSRTALAA